MHAGIDAEGSGHALQQDVAGAEGQADTQSRSHSAFSLTGGYGHTDGGQDECGKGRSPTLVVFYFKHFQVSAASDTLFLYIVFQF